MSEEIQPERQNDTVDRFRTLIETDPIRFYDLRVEILNEAKTKIGPQVGGENVVQDTQIYHAISGSSTFVKDNFPWDVPGSLIEAFLEKKLDEIDSQQ